MDEPDVKVKRPLSEAELGGPEGECTKEYRSDYARR